MTERARRTGTGSRPRSRLPLLLIWAAALAACDQPPRTDASWVTVYEPPATSPGYNLILHGRHTPMLMDLNGNTVHVWRVAADMRARLLRNGHLLVIGHDGVVREYDWDGRKTWEFRLPGEDFPHHDVIALENGNRLILALDDATKLDYLLEVDDDGRVAWEWRSQEHLAASELPPPLEPGVDGYDQGFGDNRTHANSIHELPPNRWFDGGDQRFRPGNILISVRNMNAIYVIDKATKEIAWRYDRGLDHQHEAVMIPRGHPGDGHILLLDNGLQDLYGYRSSSVLLIDPRTDAVVWSYRSPEFFTSISGVVQSLPNGNLQIASSNSGRVFEINRAGDIVWQWAPPFKPMRDIRYPVDHCPQLASLSRPRPTRVEPPATRHIDTDLYRFAIGPQEGRNAIAGRRRRRTLADPNVCRRLMLPERPLLSAKLAFVPAPDQTGSIAVTASISVRTAAAGAGQSAAVTPSEGGAARVLLERELRFDGAESSPIIEERVDLSEHGLETIELCFAASGPDGAAPDPGFFWLSPVISNQAAAPSDDATEPGDAPGPSPRERLLRAHGYVD